MHLLYEAFYRALYVSYHKSIYYKPVLLVLSFCCFCCCFALFGFFFAIFSFILILKKLLKIYTYKRQRGYNQTS